MVGVVNFSLIACLLQGVLCGQFEASMPQTIEVLSGSCVTIPCSFDVRDDHESNVDSTCKAIWKIGRTTTVFDSSNPGTTINGELTGNLTKKDCTTTLNNMQPAKSSSYSFRLECSNALKYGFSQLISISVKADPPRPTLTPSTLKVKEGTSVNLTCSAPAPCLSHPPTLIWTSGLYNSQETLQENRDKTKVKTSVVNFPASHLHHGKTISCTATYNKQDGSTESSVSTSLTADISFAPQILHSSDCTTAAAQLNCSCRTVGNPPPTIQWYLDGLPVNHSGKFVISNEDLNGTGLRSIITVNQPQERDLSSLLCHSSNSLGSASLKFHVSLQPQTSPDSQVAPQILHSSDCTTAAAQLNCSCRTVGNPPPTIQWYLDGLPVNHSGKFVISNEDLNGTGLRSIITVNQPQERDLSNLLCHSSNSLGSASLKFHVSLQPSQDSPDRFTLLFAAIIGVLTAALICAVLFAIRAHRTGCHNPTQSQSTGDTSTAVMSRGLTSEKGNEKLSITTEEDIYVNTNMMRKSDTPHTHQQVAIKSSEKKNEEGGDMVYSLVTWKSMKKKGKHSMDVHQPASSYLEEERCMMGGVCRRFMGNTLEMGSLYDNITPRNVEKEAESEYAKIQFTDKSAMH